MIRKHLKVLIITSLIILLPMLAGIILWKRLPEQIPMHWNFAGEVDGWGSKAFAVFGMPAILLGFQWVCALGTFMDPKRANHTGKILHLVFWIIPAISLIVNALTYTAAFDIDVPVGAVMCAFMGLLFVIIGNYMPKCKQNYTIGIKIPWTLSSEANWNRTHRFAGRMWVVCGLITIATGFLSNFWLFLILVFLMIIVPMVYSYILHRRGV